MCVRTHADGWGKGACSHPRPSRSLHVHGGTAHSMSGASPAPFPASLGACADVLSSVSSTTPHLSLSPSPPRCARPSSAPPTPHTRHMALASLVWTTKLYAPIITLSQSKLLTRVHTRTCRHTLLILLLLRRPLLLSRCVAPRQLSRTPSRAGCAHDGSMPGVDLLDAFAELVVRVVFNLPHTEPDKTSSSDEDPPYGANSSATQIFSRVNSLEEEQQQLQLLNDTALAHMSASNDNSAGNSAIMATSCSDSISRGSSAASLDLYPGGFWNALARVPTAAAVNESKTSRPSSVVSLATGDNLSTPRSGGGLWNRILGGSGRTQTPPHTPSCSPAWRTGLTTTTSSFVQLTDEELGMGAAAIGIDGGVGAAHNPGGGSGVSGGFSLTHTTAHSNASTPLREARPLPSPSSSNPHRQPPQQQQPMGSRGLHLGRCPTQNGSGNGGHPSQRSSSSEFDIL
ncbi:hypothetical protein, conserved [Leishmania tarentolae]|uniref:Uncharacterized protein n=1 Tax=Leishmania tarentolae TaxID=5689 RepID=A0A640K7L4_LEITA|nr:hypothetical protein, conserved [Leishmania tarentolae]